MSGPVSSNPYTYASLAKELGPDSSMNRYVQYLESRQDGCFLAVVFLIITILVLCSLANKLCDLKDRKFVQIFSSCLLSSVAVLYAIAGLKDAFESLDLHNKRLTDEEIEHYRRVEAARHGTIEMVPLRSSQG